MSGISTHVLDTSAGQPARGMEVTLERRSGASGWVLAGQGVTDENGRIPHLLAAPEAAAYRLTFRAGEYFASRESFYPEITVQFVVRDPSANYHIPLLLSPYGYTTYRGS
jgi:5-hydroxyisourate hydrolase